MVAPPPAAVNAAKEGAEGDVYCFEVDNGGDVGVCDGVGSSA